MAKIEWSTIDLPVLGVWCTVSFFHFIDLESNALVNWNQEFQVNDVRKVIYQADKIWPKGSKSRFVPVVANIFPFLFLFVLNFCRLLKHQRSSLTLSVSIWVLTIRTYICMYVHVGNQNNTRNFIVCLCLVGSVHVTSTLDSWLYDHIFFSLVAFLASVAHFFILFASVSISLSSYFVPYFNFQSNWQWHRMSTQYTDSVHISCLQFFYDYLQLFWHFGCVCAYEYVCVCGFFITFHPTLQLLWATKIFITFS